MKPACIIFLLWTGVCATSFALAQSGRGVRDVPEQLPATMRPASASQTPNALRPVDYFGAVRNPRLEVYDPYGSPLFKEGRDTIAEQLPDGLVLRDLSHRHVVRFGSLPTVAVTSGRAVSVLMLRNGKIIIPKFADIVPPPDGMVQVLPVKHSPYLYFQAREGAVFPANYNYTHVFIPMELEKRPVQFQIRLKVVRPDSDELAPLVMLDMVGDFPDVQDESRPSSAADDDGAVGIAGGRRFQKPDYVFSASGDHGAGPTPVSPPFSREEVRNYFPTMIEMAKIYEQAVHDGASGYSPRDIVRFRPMSVKGGEVVSGKIPAFRNPVDGQVYFLPWGYYFPQYDAIVYELVLQNRTSRDLWFDYALLKVLFGFDKPADRLPRGPKSVVVSPESYEVTPAGRYNTFWVLVQGTGVYPVTTPVRFLFPNGGGFRAGPLAYGEGGFVPEGGE